jgi:hypothetical protein
VSYLFGFFIPLGALAIVIFLLSLLQYSINSDVPESARDFYEKHRASDENQENIERADYRLVADAIHAYRRRRQADERHRAQREKITTIVLTFTAIFALVAALAAIYSALIFQGQFGEMQIASKLTRESNNTNRQALTAVQRAFIVVDHLEFLPQYLPNGEVLTWIINPVVVNSGNTPTRHLYWLIGFGGPGLDKMRPNVPKPRDPPEFPSIRDIRSHKGMTSGIIGPHSEVKNLTTLNGAMDWVLEGNDLQVDSGSFVWGTFHYGDAFDPDAGHIMEFCFILDRPALVGKKTVPYERCDHHNCADDECTSIP